MRSVFLVLLLACSMRVSSEEQQHVTPVNCMPACDNAKEEPQDPPRLTLAQDIAQKFSEHPVETLLVIIILLRLLHEARISEAH